MNHFLLKQRVGVLNGGGLQIEAEDVPLFADEFREEERIVPVADGGIDNDIAGVQPHRDRVLRLLGDARGHGEGTTAISSLPIVPQRKVGFHAGGNSRGDFPQAFECELLLSIHSKLGGSVAHHHCAFDKPQFV
jgi:hypothetical protein